MLFFLIMKYSSSAPVLRLYDALFSLVRNEKTVYSVLPRQAVVVFCCCGSAMNVSLSQGVFSVVQRCCCIPNSVYKRDQDITLKDIRIKMKNLKNLLLKSFNAAIAFNDMCHIAMCGVRGHSNGARVLVDNE
jgi:hypothetical protein